MPDSFHRRVVGLIKLIPEGRVASYGQIAAMAGNPRAARQVVRALHASSHKEQLPWHRVINAWGHISLPRRAGYEEQKARLLAEGVCFQQDDVIDLERFGWEGK